MKTKYLTLGVLSLLLSITSAHAQYELKKREHYAPLSPHYQVWLDEVGLGEMLRVDSVEVKNETLHLILKPNVSKGDSAKGAWFLLKQIYDQQHSHELEEVLYYNAANAFQVKLDKLIVEVLDDYNNACLWVELSYDMEKRKVIKRQSICKTKKAEFTMDIGEIKNKALKFDMSDDLKNRKQVYAAILRYAKAEYSPLRKGDEVVFRYEPGQNDKLVFMVIGLRQEVLKAEDNLWIGDFLNWTTNTHDYDWRKVEVLQFTITYKKANNQQIHLSCEIDGRYGSGYYKTTDWHKCIPMDPEFDWYLQDYTNAFRTQLYELFSND